MSPKTHRQITSTMARESGARLFALDYRLAPEHQFPCQAMDALAGYLYLIETVDPKKIVVMGDSAGGG